MTFLVLAGLLCLLIVGMVVGGVIILLGVDMLVHGEIIPGIIAFLLGVIIVAGTVTGVSSYSDGIEAEEKKVSVTIKEGK